MFEQPSSDTEPQSAVEAPHITPSPDRVHIQETLLRELERRTDHLYAALRKLGLSPHDALVAPPVTDRTDFGYQGSLDVLFFGTDEDADRLRTHFSTPKDKIPPYHLHISSISPTELTTIQDTFPVLYTYIQKARETHENAPLSTNTSETYVSFDEGDLDERMRQTLLPEDKELLKGYRSKIGAACITEIEKHFPVLASTLSGSMMHNMDHFGLNSDLDIDIVVDTSEENLTTLYTYTRYLSWTYAELYDIKLDIGIQTFAMIQEELQTYPERADYYQTTFGLIFEQGQSQ